MIADIFISLLFVYIAGFSVTFALAARYMFRRRALGHVGFTEARSSAILLGAAICAMLWPLTVDSVVTGLLDVRGGAE